MVTCPAVPLVDVQPRLQEILDGLQVALACCSEELQVRHDNKLSCHMSAVCHSSHFTWAFSDHSKTMLGNRLVDWIKSPQVDCIFVESPHF